jgi:hypothetical protein
MKKSVLMAVAVCLSVFMMGLPSVAEESAAPGTLTLDSLSSLYGPVAFEHGMHTELAESCSDCHHKQKNLKEGGKAMPCKTCHKTFDPDQDEKPGLKGALHRTCFKCHEVEAGSDPAGCSGACHTKK